jgi:hypothetical protein
MVAITGIVNHRPPKAEKLHLDTVEAVDGEE